MPSFSSALSERLPPFVRSGLDRIKASPLGKRIAGGVFWSVIGAAASRILALVVSIFTARLLGKQAFGELGVIQSTVNMFATFATFGLGLTATRHVAEYRIADPARAGRIIGMSSLMSWTTGSLMLLLIMLTAPWLARDTLAAPHLTDLLRISALLLVFTVVNEAQIGSLSGLEAFRRRSLIQMIAGFIGFPIALVCVYLFGLPGAVWGLALSQGVLVFLNARGVSVEARKFGVPISWRISRSELKIFWQFSIPTLLGSAVYVPAIWVANAIIVRYPGGYSEMGLFNAADRWRTAIMFIPGLLGGVALPMLSNLRAESDQTKYFQVLGTNVKLSLLFSLMAALPVILGAHWIMAAFGAGFADGKQVLIGLCVVAVISATSWIYVQSIVSEGRMWLLCFLNLSWAIVLVGTCWWLRSHGAKALVLAYLFAEGSRLLLVYLVALQSQRAGLARA